MEKLRMTLLLIGFVILSPLMVPTALILHGVYLRRLRAAADQFKCFECGQILGRKSIELADGEWARRMREYTDQHPGIRIRVVRNLHAICPNCGRQYQFDEKTRSFAEHLSA